MFLDVLAQPDRKSWEYKYVDKFAEAIDAGISTELEAQNVCNTAAKALKRSKPSVVRQYMDEVATRCALGDPANPTRMGSCRLGTPSDFYGTAMVPVNASAKEVKSSNGKKRWSLQNRS